MCQIFGFDLSSLCLYKGVKFGFPCSYMQGRAPTVTTCEQENVMPALSMWLPAKLQSVSLGTREIQCVCLSVPSPLRVWAPQMHFAGQFLLAKKS